MEKNEEAKTSKKNLKRISLFLRPFQNKKILDFGGNFTINDPGGDPREKDPNYTKKAGYPIGNLLLMNPDLPNENYTCVDINHKSMLEGKERFPNAKWIHYNRYNPMYNPKGNKKEFPDLNEKYDLIYSYSVFSHTAYEDLIEFIQFFKTKLNKDGVMYLSVVINTDVIVRWFEGKRNYEYGNCDSLSFCPETYYYLVDNKIQDEIPDSCKYLVTVYNKEFLRDLGEVVTSNLPQSFLKISYK